METCKEHRALEAKKAKRQKLGGIAAKKLLAAAEALDRYTYACQDMGDRINLDDDRVITRNRMRELGHHLDAVCNKEGS